MIYRPIEGRRLWDSWLFPWQDKYHLFFLETQVAGFDHIGHAVSEDLVHWEPLPSIAMKGEEGTWNSRGALTGMVIERDGLFYMFAGSIPDQQEVVGLLLSEDLIHWRQHEGNPILTPQPPYLTERAEAPYWPVDWRDPCVFWHEADLRYHAVFFARLPQWSADDTGAALAHACSEDLIHWETLPPLAKLGERCFHCEVPDWFKLNGRWYLTFNTLSAGGIEIDTPARDEATGTFYLMSDNFDTGFELPQDPLLIGAGLSPECRSYSARTIPYVGGRLLYHHVNAARPAWGTPKLVRADVEGKLWLGYFSSLEKLETGVICNSFGDLPESPKLDLGHWQHDALKLQGAAKATGTSYLVASDVSDLHFQCEIRIVSASCAGVVLRANGKTGVAVLLDIDRQRVQIGRAEGREVLRNSIGAFGSWHCTVLDSCRLPLQPEKTYHLRCFARSEHFEVYLDDRWVLTTAIPEAAAVGDVEVCLERGTAEFSEFRLAALEPFA